MQAQKVLLASVERDENGFTYSTNLAKHHTHPTPIITLLQVFYNWWSVVVERL